MHIIVDDIQHTINYSSIDEPFKQTSFYHILIEDAENFAERISFLKSFLKVLSINILNGIVKRK